MNNQPKVVNAPVVFVECDAQKFGDRLCAALANRRVVVADLTRTAACDAAAIAEICVANDLAARSSRELRVVIASAAVLRQFALAGLDAELLIYPSLNMAIKPGLDAPAGRPKWGRSSLASTQRTNRVPR